MLILVKLNDRVKLPLPDVPVVLFPRSFSSAAKALWAVETSPDCRALPTAARSVLRLVLAVCEFVLAVLAVCEFVLAVLVVLAVCEFVLVVLVALVV